MQEGREAEDERMLLACWRSVQGCTGNMRVCCLWLTAKPGILSRMCLLLLVEHKKGQTVGS